VTELRTAIFN